MNISIKWALLPLVLVFAACSSTPDAPSAAPAPVQVSAENNASNAASADSNVTDAADTVDYSDPGFQNLRSAIAGVTWSIIAASGERIYFAFSDDGHSARFLDAQGNQVSQHSIRVGLSEYVLLAGLNHEFYFENETMYVRLPDGTGFVPASQMDAPAPPSDAAD